MAFSFCFCHPQVSLKIGLVMASKCSFNSHMNPRSSFAVGRVSKKPFGQRHDGPGTKLSNDCSFLRGSRSIILPELRRTVSCKKSSRVCASWLPASQIASSVFTLGTAAVLPFYTLMVVAPRTELTKRSMESSMPYVVLGLLYAYLLCLSWTPETFGCIFANNYWMPELPGIAKMFSSEMTLASAWIHLLAVDLFAARQVYHDGLQNNIETRHSVSLCLLFCPVGVLTHFITKALITNAKRNGKQMH